LPREAISMLRIKHWLVGLFRFNGLPAARVPCASRKTRRSPKLAVYATHKPLKQGSLLPRFAAMLGGTDSPKKPDKPTLQPLWQIPGDGKPTYRHSGAGRNPCVKSRKCIAFVCPETTLGRHCEERQRRGNLPMSPRLFQLTCSVKRLPRFARALKDGEDILRKYSWGAMTGGGRNLTFSCRL